MQLQQAVQSGQMLEERMMLEIEKMMKDDEAKLAQLSTQLISQAQAELTTTENKILSEKAYNVLAKNEVSSQFITNGCSKIL